MTTEIKRSQDWLDDAKKRLTEVQAAADKTSDRSEIGRLKVEAKLIEVEVEDATNRIEELNKNLEQREIEYNFRKEQQDFEAQIDALYQRADTFHTSE